MSTLELAEVAADQWGLITTAQAGAIGSSAQAIARLAGDGRLERLTHGVYRLTGTPGDPADELRAAWLALDPKRRASDRLRDHVPDVVSHRSAAWLHELGDLDADRLEFTVVRRRQSRRPDVRLHRARLSRNDWTLVDGLPVTTVVRTITDLAAAHTDGGHLAGVVRDAVTMKPVDVDVVIHALQPYARRYGAPTGDGRAVLARFLDEAGVPETSHRIIELVTARDRAERRAALDEMMRSIPPEQLEQIGQAIADALAKARNRSDE